MDILNRVVWITGTSTGIGRSLSLGFAKRGAIVIATCLGGREKSNGLDEMLKSVSEKSMVLEQDVTNEKHAVEVTEKISREFGTLDVLINNAGVYPRQPADEMTNEQWHQMMRINLDGAWYSCQSAIPLMKKQGYGNLIQVGSITPIVGMMNLTHYMSSKMGVLGMTRGLARDLGPYGIRVNCVVLGAVLTEGEKEIIDADSVLALVNEKQCIEGRILPKDVEPTFAFLASASSDAITGQSITVDLGWTHTT